MPDAMKQEYLGLAISIVAVSFASVLIKSCTGSPPLGIAFFRLLFTTLLLLPFVALQGKIRSELRTLPRRDLLIMVVIGCVLAAHFALWITSLSYTSVASSVILVTAHPIIVAPLSYVLLRERLSAVNAAGIAISLAGVILLVAGNNQAGFALDSLEGNILAWLGGVAAGLYILGGRFMRRTTSVLSYALVVYAVAAAVLFVLATTLEVPLGSMPMQDLGIILLMALVSGILGHTLYNWALGHIRASVASVALLGEPVGSSVLAFVLPWIAQAPPTFTIYGGAVIFLGIYLTTRPVTTTEGLR
jgi:drug/metabolite transporter (DMT)-like permease